MRDYSCTITEAGLDLLTAPYDLEKNSFADEAVTWRKQEVSNRWVEGSYVTSAVRDNVRESLNVWVEDPDWVVLDAALQTLLDAISQLQWTLTFGVDNLACAYTCQPADYTIDSTQEYREAGKVLVKATIIRLPTVVRTIS